MKKISIVVAIADNMVIGKDNKLLWHLPEDMKWFKRHTSGCDVVMGRKTYESLPPAFRPLPNRRNIVITHSDLSLDGCIMARSVEDAVDKMDSEKENFIIGGGNIYEQFLPLTQKLYITQVHHNFDGDTFFPAIDSTQWKLVSSEDHPQDDKHAFSFTFQIFERS